MTIKEILEKSQKAKLRTEMEIYLAFLLKKNRLQLLSHGEEDIPVGKLADLQKAWVDILNGKPIQYLTNRKEFYGIDFYVDERVLIPRDETEQLVDLVLKHASKKAKILEVGTGSGAISIALKSTNQEFDIFACDVSKDALEVAKINSKNLDIRFIESDLLEAIPNEDFEILVANLPYIGEVKNHFIADSVKNYEPAVALFGGYDGLRLYAKMFDQVLAQKRNFKFIFGEIGFSHGLAIKELCEQKFPHGNFRLSQDLSGLDRHFMVENPR